MTSYPLECILFPPSFHGHKQSQESSDRMLHDCVLLSFFLSQRKPSSPAIFRLYTISTISLWTRSAEGSACTLYVHPQCIYGNTHDQLPFDYCFQPQAMDIIIQSNAALVYIYPQCIIIWKNPWPVTLWVLPPTSGYGHHYSEQCGLGLHGLNFRPLFMNTLRTRSRHISLDLLFCPRAVDTLRTRFP